MSQDDLGHNATDTKVALLKSIAGPIPGVGPLLSEIITTVIPNQRIDRISNFLKEVNERVTELELEQLKNNQYFIDLFEDGLVMASRALTEERNKYIATFLSKSKNVSQDEYGAKKKLLHLLEELADKDIDILRDFNVGELHAMSKHRASFVSESAYSEMNEDEKYESDIEQVSLKAHVNTLVRLSLLFEKRDVPNPSSTQEYVEFMSYFLDEETGLARIAGYGVSKLGKVLLASIGE